MITSSLLSAAKALTGMGEAVGDLRSEIDAKVDRIPVKLNEYGYDPWGFRPQTFKDVVLPTALLYRYYFRCRTTGLENLPQGRMLLIGNHAGQIAFDGAMILAAMVLEAEPPRLVRGMGEYWLGTLPWLNVFMDRTGSAVGTRQTCVDMLREGECVMAFPEGVRGMNKIYADAYRLMEFGSGFMRLALASDTPIVPVSVVGSEEQQPGLANLEGVGKPPRHAGFPHYAYLPLAGALRPVAASGSLLDRVRSAAALHR